MSKNPTKIDISLLAFKISLAAGIFLLGGGLVQSQIYPFTFIDKGIIASKTLTEETIRSRPNLLNKISYSGHGVTINDTKNTFKGLTLLQGWFAGASSYFSRYGR